jgi:hypothetical protein
MDKDELFWTHPDLLDLEVQDYMAKPPYPPPPEKCGTCGTLLYTNGLCPVCDRR